MRYGLGRSKRYGQDEPLTCVNCIESRLIPGCDGKVGAVAI